MVKTKACFKCGSEKPLDAFYPHSRMGDGYLNKCKDCTKRDGRLHRLANPEHVRARELKKNRHPKEVARRKARADQFKIEHPEKVKAHQAVSNALRDGRIAKLPCAFCSGQDGLEAHHHDYAKPLDVTWLCRPCHRRFHALERMATYREMANA